LRGLVITAPWLLYLLSVDVIISLLLPVAIILPRWVYNTSSRLAFSVWTLIQLIFESCNGAHIEISGDALPKGESAVVIVNHIAWSDFYMIQALAQRCGMLGYCRYFAKSQLKFVPFLGWGLWALGMPMVSRNWLRDKSELDRVFSGIVKDGFPTCEWCGV
jgi:1-acyl-sn-glycerol-3-phosphate acyltransferase